MAPFRLNQRLYFQDQFLSFLLLTSSERWMELGASLVPLSETLRNRSTNPSQFLLSTWKQYSNKPKKTKKKLINSGTPNGDSLVHSDDDSKSTIKLKPKASLKKSSKNGQIQTTSENSFCRVHMFELYLELFRI